MELAVNPFKQRLREGRRQIGLWLSFGSAMVAEVVGDSGFDWVLIDTEHAPTELPAVIDQLRVLDHGPTAPVVRPAWNDTVLFKRILDVGAQTLLVPYVQTKEEAERAVLATRYPTRGVRGVASNHRSNRYGRIADYVHKAHEQTCLIVQIETRAAVANLESIAGVDGVDAVFVGPSDLSADHGHIGNAGHPDIQKIIKDVLARAGKLGKPAGILAPVEDDAKRYLDWGFSFVAVGADIGVLRMGCDRLRKAFAG